MRQSTRYSPLALLLSLMLLLWSSGPTVDAFNQCQVPPMVGFAAKPNVLMVLDYSGSMQFPAYFDYDHQSYYDSKVAYANPAKTLSNYDPGAKDYYGMFASDQFYRYNTTTKAFEENDTCTLTRGTITSSASGNTDGTQITFTASGITLAVDDAVRLNGLDSHTIMNGRVYRVVSADSSTFTVTAKWNGTADTTGTVTKKTVGTENCISGDVLNWATTTRIDAALKALTGGRATCDSENCTLRAQGSTRIVMDSSLVNALFFARPGVDESESGGTVHPWNYKTGDYLLKDIYLTISNYSVPSSSSPEDPLNPAYLANTLRFSKPTGTYSGCDQTAYAHVWKFVVAQDNTRIRIDMERIGDPTNDGGDPFLCLYRSPSGNNGTVVGGIVTPGGDWVYVASNDDRDTTYLDNNSTIDIASASAGTYYVIATTCANYQSPTYSLNSNQDLTRLINSGGNLVGPAPGVTWPYGTTRLSNVGTLFDARLAMIVPAETRTGVIQDSFDKVRFGLIWYNNAATANIGKMAVGCDNTDVNTLVSAFDSLIPYYGTPSGEALKEAMYYLKQQSLSGYADNSAFIASGTIKDPYYSALLDGTNFLCCRKSYVLLVSDGEWNGSLDPVSPAYDMHTLDLRSESSCPTAQAKQTADVYAIWAFSSDAEGDRAMKTVAAFGGFKDVSGCSGTNYPYPFTAVPSDSRDVTWPRSGCDPAVTYDKKCCGEWDIAWDKDTEGDNLLKGIPDNYYQASDGNELARAITKILEGVLTGNAAAGAVATISQEIRGQDVILRGVFQVSDVNAQDKYLWFGHLESYSPFYINGEWKYAFEFCCNTGQLCVDMPGPTGTCTDSCPSEIHCWDAAQHLVPANRIIYAWKDADSDGIVDSGEFRAFTAADFISALALTSREDCDHDGSYINDSNDAESLVAWIRGEATQEGTGHCYRSRTDEDSNRWILGDIVYSTPVIVGTPAVGAVSQNDPNVDAFYTFRNAEIAKLAGPVIDNPTVSQVVKRMVYVGANDGMVHAFVLAVWDWRSSKWVYERNASDPFAKYVGDELWSYIPSNLISELKALADPSYGNIGCKHRTMVDLSPRSYYVFIDPDGAGSEPAQWRNVLLGGERGGGDVYFAIDITNPDNPRLIWEFSVLKNLLRYVSCPVTWDDNRNYSSTTKCSAKRNRWCNQCCPSVQSGYQTECNRIKTRCCVGGDCQCCVSPPCAGGGTGYVTTGFRNTETYPKVKMLPITWSRPFVGRLNLPTSGVTFYTGDPVSGAPSGPFSNGNKHFVFVGGGFMLFDQNLTDVATDDLEVLRHPHFFAIDMETGTNLFRYVWPYLRQNMSGYTTLFPSITVGTNKIPYAMSDPLALDLWNNNCTGTACTGSLGDDGFIDHIYVGDLTGTFYGFKFNFHPNAIGGKKGMLVDLWLTKGIYQPTSSSNAEYSTDWSQYRQQTQPITVQPTASLDGADMNYLRVIFGTGKYDQVVSGQDDKSDPAKMSLYNLKDLINLPDLSVSTGYGGEIFSNSGLWVRLNPKCGAVDPTSRQNKFYSNLMTTNDTKCTWIKTTGTYSGSHDCCEQANPSCAGSTPCWDCIYDLVLPFPGEPLNPTDGRLKDPGERILGRPLIAGGLVFVTTYVPSRDYCDYLGNAFLYVFDYMCEPFPQGFDPIPDPAVQRANFYTDTARTELYGVRVEVGKGLPSEPVLDSAGEHIIIQTSNADIHRIAVELLKKPFQVKGWKEK